MGVRRAVVATPARAARTSSAVTGEDSTVATSVRLSLARGTPWGMKALGTPETLLPQRRHARRGPAVGRRARSACWGSTSKAARCTKATTPGGRGPCDPRCRPGSARPGQPRTPGPRPRRAGGPARDRRPRDPATSSRSPKFPHGREGMRANDGDVDPAGRFWIGTMCQDEAPDPRSALPLRPRRHPLTPVLQPGQPLQRPRLGRRRAAHVLRRHADEAGRRARLRRRDRRGREPPAVLPLHRGRRRVP